MLRALLAIFSTYSATKSADRYEARYGPLGRLRVLVSLPAQTAVSYLASLVILRLIGPIKQAFGRPVSPAGDRVAALWVGLLAQTRVAGAPMSAGLTLSTLDGISSVRTGGPGSAPYVTAVQALDDDELRAVLAHEIGHLRFAHVMLISFATAALAAGWPLVIRRLMGVAGPAKVESRGRDDYSWLDEKPRGRRGRRRSLAQRLQRADLESATRKSVQAADAGARAKAATTLSVVSAAAVVAAIQRACERNADDYAARVAGPDKLASAIATIENQRVSRNRRPGRRAAYWRFDEKLRRSLLAPFSPDPSPASRIARLRRR